MARKSTEIDRMWQRVHAETAHNLRSLKTISISPGVVKALSEALEITIKQLNILNQQPRKPFQSMPMYDVQADFFRRLNDELVRVLNAEQQEKIFVHYEVPQDWNSR